MLKTGETVFPGKSTSADHLIPMLITEHMHTDNTILAEQIIFRDIYVNAYKHVTIINEKRA